MGGLRDDECLRLGAKRATMTDHRIGDAVHKPSSRRELLANDLVRVGPSQEHKEQIA